MQELYPKRSDHVDHNVNPPLLFILTSFFYLLSVAVCITILYQFGWFQPILSGGRIGSSYGLALSIVIIIPIVAGLIASILIVATNFGISVDIATLKIFIWIFFIPFVPISVIQLLIAYSNNNWFDFIAILATGTPSIILLELFHRHTLTRIYLQSQKSVFFRN